MKRYRNVGTSPLELDHKSILPGEAFSSELTPEQENFLIRIGAIEEVAEEPATKDGE